MCKFNNLFQIIIIIIIFGNKKAYKLIKIIINAMWPMAQRLGGAI